MNIRNHNILTSRLFILGLLLLLLNDFYLKGTFGNTFTGKLSDFSGLFIFPLFWTFIFPSKKNGIYIFTFLLFIFWKSEYSQSAIEFWNSFNLINLNRVIDYTDLIALIILPVSYKYGDSQLKTLKINPFISFLVCAFAFTATSYQTNIEGINKTYTFNYSKDSLKEKLLNLKLTNIKRFTSNYYLDSTKSYRIQKHTNDSILDINFIPAKIIPDQLTFAIEDDFCFDGYSAFIECFGDSISSGFELINFTHVCPKNENGNNDAELLTNSFEKRIINQLKN